MRGARIPKALRWLLVAVTLAGVTWALVVPPWQVPDEDSHFAYAQTVAELHDRPGDEPGPGQSTEQQLAQNDSGFRRSYQRLETNPAWTQAAEDRWRRAEAELGADARQDGGGEVSSQNNPPTFYVYSALAYEAAGGTVLDRLYAMRLWSVPLLLLFATSAWLLAGELGGRNRVAQLCAGALAGLLPMVTFISASVNPDAMLLPLWGLATWLGVRVLRHGASRGRVVALLAATLATLAVKPIALALVPAVLWVLGVALWRRRARPPVSRRAWVLAGAGLVAGAIAVAVATSPGGASGLADYLWQFYLPELPGQEHIAELSQWPVRDVWFEGVTGAFGWLEIRFPALVSIGLALVAIALAVLVARGRRGWADGATAVFLLLPFATLVAGLHVIENRYIVSESEGFIQGRYLLPLAAAAAAAVGAGIASLRGRRQMAVAGAVLGGLVVWQVASLAIVAARFYA